MIKQLRSQLHMRKPFAWALGILGIGTLLVGMFAPTVTPNMVNTGRIISLSHAIAEYSEQYHALPDSLDKLDYNPLLKQDKWKRQFIYLQTGNNEFMLSTLGADGSPGGIWSNADLIKKYRCENGIAHWIDQSPK